MIRFPTQQNTAHKVYAINCPNKYLNMMEMNNVNFGKSLQQLPEQTKCGIT